LFSILLNEGLHSINFLSAEASAILQPDWIKPEFSFFIITLNMNVGRFVAITGVKEKTIRAALQYSWHLLIRINFLSKDT